MPSTGSAKCQVGGQNQKWPTTWRWWLHNPRRLGGPQCFKAEDKIGPSSRVGLGSYIIHAVGGVPNASEQGTKSEVTHNWALVAT